MEFRLVVAVVVVLIVALFAIRAVWSGSAHPDPVGISPGAPPDAAAAARAMTFAQSKAASP